MTTDHRDHVANIAARRAAETAFKLVDKLREELGYQMGAEEMSTRAVRALIRKAKQGDDKAMIAVVRLHQQQHHQAPLDNETIIKALQGDDQAMLAFVRLHQQQTSVPNPVAREIDAVLKEE